MAETLKSTEPPTSAGFGEAVQEADGDGGGVGAGAEGEPGRGVGVEDGGGGGGVVVKGGGTVRETSALNSDIIQGTNQNSV